MNLSNQSPQSMTGGGATDQGGGTDLTGQVIASQTKPKRNPLDILEEILGEDKIKDQVKTAEKSIADSASLAQEADQTSVMETAQEAAEAAAQQATDQQAWQDQLQKLKGMTQTPENQARV